MTEKKQIFKCEMCGNIIEMLHEGAGELVCCEKPMQLFTENSVDAAKEKHVPVIEKTNNGFKVKLGSIAHPMEDKHYIEWIEATSSTNETCRIFLKPGDEPVAEFNFEPVSARMYCNIHGLWKG